MIHPDKLSGGDEPNPEITDVVDLHDSIRSALEPTPDQKMIKEKLIQNCRSSN